MDPPTRTVRRQCAKVQNLAEENRSNESANSTLDEALLSRIHKCLARAKHENANEAEALAAMRMANRLMEQNNIKHADLIAAGASASQPATIAGQSTVTLTNVDGFKQVIFETWVNQVIDAITVFFDCEAYSTQSYLELDWTFYGIAANTTAAAIAFEMVYNLIHEWSSNRRKGNKNSYRFGIADGLVQTAANEKEAEEQRAKQEEARSVAERETQEQNRRQMEVNRLHPTEDSASSFAVAAEMEHDDRTLGDALPNTEDSLNDHEPESMCADDEEEDDNSHGGLQSGLSTFKQEEEQPLDFTANFEDELQRHLPQKLRSPSLAYKCETADIKSEEAIDVSSALRTWPSPGALILFRQNAAKIAEDYLKLRGEKLGQGRKRCRSVRDQAAYNDGREDSKKIDVKRRRIEH